MPHAFRILTAISWILTIDSCSTPQEASLAKPVIVPAPKYMEFPEGQIQLNGAFQIIAASAIEKETSEFLSDYFAIVGKEVFINPESGDQPTIQLNLIESLGLEKEAYQITVDQSGIRVKASTRSGLFYGVQSLIQILSTSGDKIPYMTITDKPRFDYRGMHLDVGRHMFPVSFIKKYIDLMSRFKFNAFHWHLTEDQGWRIEIKQYPKLQTVAANRAETAIGYTTTRTRDQATYDGTPYGGYYTQDEVREIVAYANDRNVMVIPEIELPGHARASLAAYPHLGCTGGPYQTATTWGVFQDIYCGGQESTFEFLENVFEEIIPLFPGPYIHIGGDEAPKSRWEACPHCQKRIREEGLKDEGELQSYFVQRIEKFLNGKGKTIIGWDEILEGGLAPNAVVMSWRGEEGGIEAAQQDHQVIMTPGEWCYFDYYQADMETEPLAIKRLTTVEKVYGYEPVPPQLSTDQRNLILGAQCNLWSEYITSADHAEYMVYPRAIAMSEVLWSAKETRDFQAFVQRVEELRPLMDSWDINYATHIFDQQKLD